MEILHYCYYLKLSIKDIVINKYSYSFSNVYYHVCIFDLKRNKECMGFYHVRFFYY